MNDNFQKAIAFTLPHEGYKVNDPRDPGKLTIWGISIVYHPVEVAKMVGMSKEGAMQYASLLYRKQYWGPAGCDNLPWPLDIVIFDTAVNLGIGRAMEFLAGGSDWVGVLFKRLAYYTTRKGAPLYLKGWTNRVVDLYRYVTR